MLICFSHNSLLTYLLQGMEEEEVSLNGSCDVYYQVYPDLATSYYAIVPFAVVYACIFILGIAGNAALIYVTLKHRTLQVRPFRPEDNNSDGDENDPLVCRRYRTCSF